MISAAGISQTNFKKGYIVDIIGDTLHGLIDFRGDFLNGKRCDFKSGTEAKLVSFSPGEIACYRFSGSKYYISKTLLLTGKEELVFAEYLVNGIASLYFHRSIAGDHYFIETRDGHLAELINEAIQVEGISQKKYWQYNNKHVGILKASFADCPEIQSSLNGAKLDHGSLISLTKKYHEYVCDDELCMIYEKEVPRISVMLGPVIGYSMTNFKIENSSLYENFIMKSMIPTFGLSLKIGTPRINEKLSILFDVELTKGAYESYYEEHTSYGSTIKYDLYTEMTTFSFVPGLRYTYPKDKLRPTASVGLVFQGNINPVFYYTRITINEWGETSTVVEDDPLTGILFGAQACLGLEYNMSDGMAVYANARYRHTVGFSREINTLQALGLIIGLYFSL